MDVRGAPYVSRPAFYAPFRKEVRRIWETRPGYSAGVIKNEEPKIPLEYGKYERRQRRDVVLRTD